MNKTLSIFLLSMITGCGGSNSSTSSSCGSKDLMSLWTKTDQSFQFNLQGRALYITSDYTLSISGASCTMDLQIRGSQCSGLYETSNSTWNGDGGSDPGCSSLNVTETYTKSDAGLRLCNLAGTVCSDYN